MFYIPLKYEQTIKPTNDMKTLTKKLKQEWIEALRSGDYKQGQEWLHDDGKYCCLGVLQAIAGIAIDNVDLLINPCSRRSYVQNLPTKTQYKLAEMNDDGKSFKTIANWIGKNINPNN